VQEYVSRARIVYRPCGWPGNRFDSIVTQSPSQRPQKCDRASYLCWLGEQFSPGVICLCLPMAYLLTFESIWWCPRFTRRGGSPTNACPRRYCLSVSVTPGFKKKKTQTHSSHSLTNSEMALAIRLFFLYCSCYFIATVYSVDQAHNAVIYTSQRAFHLPPSAH